MTYHEIYDFLKSNYPKSFCVKDISQEFNIREQSARRVLRKLVADGFAHFDIHRMNCDYKFWERYMFYVGNRQPYFVVNNVSIRPIDATYQRRNAKVKETTEKIDYKILERATNRQKGFIF